jgi:DNA helicase-2/ATP-dependent DNA helicase PcrA
MSMDEPGRLEEERRLCYVGMTRAERQLIITYAESRRLHGSETYPRPSRFLSELPAELLREVRPRAHVTRPAALGAGTMDAEISGGLRLGQHVAHPTFGEGVVTNYEGQGSSARVQVNFAGVGSKWLVLAYAKLQAV